MLTTIRNAWKIPELRRKLLFTLVIILLYRIGNVIPVPGVNVQQMSLMFSQQLSNTIFGLFDMMSGSPSRRPPSSHCRFSRISTRPSSFSFLPSPFLLSSV